MTREEYESQGYILLEYDDNILDTLDKFEKMLRPYGLKLKMVDEICDSFEPIKIISIAD